MLDEFFHEKSPFCTLHNAPLINFHQNHHNYKCI
jgi:hypothetical protein